MLLGLLLGVLRWILLGELLRVWVAMEVALVELSMCWLLGVVVLRSLHVAAMAVGVVAWAGVLQGIVGKRISLARLIARESVG